MSRTYSEILREARSSIREVSPGEVDAIRSTAPQTAVVDVRETSEWDEGFIPGAVHVPRGFLESRIEAAIPDHDQPVIVYCAGGSRSALAVRTLEQMGYSNVTNMSGGFQAWKSQGFRWTTPPKLTAEQKVRYSRHLLIPEVGTEGQAKLLDSKVLLIGAGGLGSPAALYLNLTLQRPIGLAAPTL